MRANIAYGREGETFCSTIMELNLACDSCTEPIFTPDYVDESMNHSSISEIISLGNPKEPAVRAPDHEVIEIVDGAPPVQECTDKLCSRGFYKLFF